MQITKIHHDARKPRVCAYVRVSTDKYDQEHSFAFQSDYWSNRLSHSETEEYVGIFADEGVSGYHMKNRKNFNLMMDKVRAGEIDKIYVKSISRLSRNCIEFLKVVRELRDLNVPIVFENENINTLDAKSGLMMSVMSSLAEAELESMSKNQQWAARKRYANGSVELARIYGYVFENGKLKIVPEEVELIKLIFKLYLEGYGTEKIAKLLEEKGYVNKSGENKWARVTIIGILRNEKYIGDSLLQKYIYNMNEKRRNRGEVPQYYIENTHEAIISREDFERVQERIREQSEKYHKKPQVKTIYPLTGKILCGTCGSSYIRRTCAKGKTYESIKWSCNLKDHRSKEACASNDIKDTVITDLLVEAYNESIDAMPKIKNAEVQSIEPLLAEERELKQLHIKGYISEANYRMHLERVLNDIKEREAQNNKVNTYKYEMKKYVKSAVFTKDMADFLIRATIKDWTVTFRFANGYETTKKYTNGRAGNVNGKLKRQT